MRINPARPRRPDFPPEQIAELEIIGPQELRALRYMAGPDAAEIHLLRRTIRRMHLEEWIAWKEADAAWREARRDRINWVCLVVAFIAMFAALVAAYEGWH